ncbi:hypothetical protein JI747_008515 [Chryseobacterium sp. RG1]|uniref:Uncharacterized protein n=1 Tax=Chryseobacterium tagetis TaxID=2801334 RepID=A0ABS8A2W2_9FLAO|nr:hypothetical protein [Chryseobacterium tagetis]MCA6067215.1 hypothetical protein [Chryseobacterium tagetis]
MTIFKFDSFSFSDEKFTHLITGLKNNNPNSRNTKARFFQLIIQKKVSRIYMVIKMGKPNESKLNHGNTLGGTKLFINTPNKRMNIPKCRMKRMRRKTFTDWF